MRAWLLVLTCSLAACECGPGPECVGVEDCAGRACVDGVCAPKPDGGGPVISQPRPDSGTNTVDSGMPVLPACQVKHTGSLTGIVTEPGGRLALPNVRVYVPTTALAPQPVGLSTTCSGCEGDVSGRPRSIALTSARGEFELKDVPAGMQTLVFQLGRWRRSVTVSVTECRATAVPRAVSRLPRSSAEGDLPRIAVVNGAVDPFECLLLKLGIAPSEFGDVDAGAAVQVFEGNGTITFDGGLRPTDDLFADLSRFDHIIAPCQGFELRQRIDRVNALENYLDRGGRFFTTHYGYGWLDVAYANAAAWTPTLMANTSDDAEVFSSFPRGAIYREWLDRVAMVSSPIRITDARYNVGTTNSAAVAWLGSANRRQHADPAWTAQLTFTTPLGSSRGCGRVAFSDFHVAALAAGPFPEACQPMAELTAQEKVLAFILFDLSTCARNEREMPMVCGAIETSCTPALQCCDGLRCLAANATPCDGGTCQCAP